MTHANVIDCDGLPMRWTEEGEGVPVVLVHGIPTSPALWRKLSGRVPGARLLMWEMVGYGDSIPQGRDRDISIQRQAEYLRSWMRSIGIESAVLVGHDLGGGVVHIAAVRDPAICRGLILINSIGYDSWPIPSVKAMRSMKPLVSRLPFSLLKMNLGLLLRRGHDDRDVAEESLDIHLAPYQRHDGARALTST
jgi:pimeloyl-ACP methyl ester carboxylesterase